MAAGILIVLGVSGAAAQCLGEYARAARKRKAQPAATSRHYDNDNLPRNEQLNVVGREPGAGVNGGSAAANGNSPSNAAKAVAKDPKAEAAERQKAAEELQKKIDAQKQRVDSLNHELDLTQREYRLRAVAMYSDAGNRLRNAAMWDKEDAQYKQEMADKQKAIDAARQELDALQETARKAGMKQKDQE